MGSVWRGLRNYCLVTLLLMHLKRIPIEEVLATNSKHGLAFTAREIKAGERSGRALFPAGRGLGVGRKRK